MQPKLEAQSPVTRDDFIWIEVDGVRVAKWRKGKDNRWGFEPVSETTEKEQSCQK